MGLLIDFLELPGGGCALYQPDKYLIQRRQYFLEGINNKALADKILQHIIISIARIQLDGHFFFLLINYLEQVDSKMLGQQLVLEGDTEKVFLEILLYISY